MFSSFECGHEVADGMGDGLTRSHFKKCGNPFNRKSRPIRTGEVVHVQELCGIVHFTIFDTLNEGVKRPRVHRRGHLVHQGDVGGRCRNKTLICSTVAAVFSLERFVSWIVYGLTHYGNYGLTFQRFKKHKSLRNCLEMKHGRPGGRGSESGTTHLKKDNLLNH